MAPATMTSAPPATNTSSTPSTSSRSRIRGFVSLRSSHSNSQNNAQNAASTPNNRDPTHPPLQRSSTTPISSSNLIPNITSAWLPTVGGVSVLSRVPTAPAAESSNAVGGFRSASQPLPAEPEGSSPLVRSTTEMIPGHAHGTVYSPDTPTPNAIDRPIVEGVASGAPEAPEQGPPASIRFVPHIDLRPTRPSLAFTPMERVLRQHDEVIRVGRYSDRDAGNPLPLGFKSKVVSRRHCEFWCQGGQWYVKDVKSSSGTFLNHVRLSSPGVESRAFPIYDGDILQLGIDFKGGEEAIFRCVKMRVELNRAWQKGLNNFNRATHKKLRNLGKDASEKEPGDVASSECAICLMNVAPCQSLFVAPCSHVWHYKCVRPIILKSYPTFLCPNCRAVHDLEKEIEDEEVGDEDIADFDGDNEHQNNGNTKTVDSPEGDVTINQGDQRAEPTGNSPQFESQSNGTNTRNQNNNYTTNSDTSSARQPQPTRSGGPQPDHAARTSSLDSNDHDLDDDVLRLHQQATRILLEDDHDTEHDTGIASSRSSGSISPTAFRHAGFGTLGDTATMNGLSGDPGRLHINLPGVNLMNDARGDNINGPDGPLTPRNNAGPFLLESMPGRP